MGKEKKKREIKKEEKDKETEREQTIGHTHTPMLLATWLPPFSLLFCTVRYEHVTE